MLAVTYIEELLGTQVMVSRPPDYKFANGDKMSKWSRILLYI